MKLLKQEALPERLKACQPSDCYVRQEKNKIWKKSKPTPPTHLDNQFHRPRGRSFQQLTRSVLNESVR